VAAVIEAERRGTGLRGALGMLDESGFDLEGTPYPAFLERYFIGG
jgi:hypothetical protein